VRQGVTMRGAYFPRGLWYSPYDGALAVDATDGGRYVNLTVRASPGFSGWCWTLP